MIMISVRRNDDVNTIQFVIVVVMADLMTIVHHCPFP